MTALATGITTTGLFRDAMTSVHPLWELRVILRGLLADGHDRSSLVDDLNHMREALRLSGREDEENVVLDVMDFVDGWSAPHVSLR